MTDLATQRRLLREASEQEARRGATPCGYFERMRQAEAELVAVLSDTMGPRAIEECLSILDLTMTRYD